MTRAESPELPAAGLFARIAPLSAAMFVGFLTISVPLPVLPLHVHGDLGFGTALAGLTVGIQSFATVVTRPYSGRLVDRLGPKATLMRGLVVCSGAGLAYLLSTVPQFEAALSLLVLLVGRLILGVGESLLVTGVLSWAMVRAGPGRSGRAMSWNGMAQYTSFAAGAPLGFALYSSHGFVPICWATVLLPLAALVIVWPLEAAPPAGGTRMPLWSVIGHIWKPGLGLMLAGIGLASVSTFTSLDFAAHGWPGAGYALLAYGICFVALRSVAGHLPDHFGGRRVAAVSMLAIMSGQLLLWRAPSPAFALCGAGLTGFGCSLIFPALGVEALRQVPLQSRGIALGAFSAFQDVAVGLTGPVLGLLAAFAGAPSAFLAGAIAAVAGVFVSLALRDPHAPT